MRNGEKAFSFTVWLMRKVWDVGTYGLVPDVERSSTEVLVDGMLKIFPCCFVSWKEGNLYFYCLFSSAMCRV